MSDAKQQMTADLSAKMEVAGGDLRALRDGTDRKAAELDHQLKETKGSTDARLVELERKLQVRAQEIYQSLACIYS